MFPYNTNIIKKNDLPVTDKEQGSGPDEAGQPEHRKLCYLKMKVRYTIRLKFTQGLK